MFGNHPLPNVGPSHLFHPPPPSLRRRRHSHSPRECPNGISEGVFVVSNRHDTAAANRARHVITDDEPHTPRHRQRRAPYATSPATTSSACHITADNDHWTPHHHRQRPLSTANRSQRLPLPSLRDVGAEIDEWGVRRSEGDGERQ